MTETKIPKSTQNPATVAIKNGNGTKDAISRYSGLRLNFDRDLFNNNWFVEDTTKITNMLLLGALVDYLSDLSLDDIIKVMNEKFAPYYLKDSKLKSLNDQALKEGYEFAKNPPKNDFTGTRQKMEMTETADSKKSWKNFPNLCKGCGLCIVRCPVRALSFSNKLNFLGTQTPQVDIAKCIACIKCQEVCPDGAIEVEIKK